MKVVEGSPEVEEELSLVGEGCFFMKAPSSFLMIK